jgi:Zn-finger nucleic acid-binding protein
MGSSLPTSRQCPFCKKPTSAAAARCVHCDRRIVEYRQRDESQAVQCPDCGKTAELVRLGMLEIDLCAACGGLWFDRSEIERLPKEVSPEDLSGDVHALVARLSARRPVHKVYPQCPLCHETMNVAQYRKVSGVVVHRCRTCGIWLDGTNAAKFLLLFESGRMTELEQRETMAATQELEARVTKLERQQSLPPSPAPTCEPFVGVSAPLGVFAVLDLVGFLGSLFDG